MFYVLLHLERAWTCQIILVKVAGLLLKGGYVLSGSDQTWKKASSISVSNGVNLAHVGCHSAEMWILVTFSG